MTISEVIRKGMIELKNGNVESPNLKARLLIQFILNQTRQYIIVNDKKQIDKQSEKEFFEAIQKIREGIPIEHITHQKEFMKLNFFVDENVLIPRQDTEILVEEVIKIADNTNSKKILDLCTGSGAIAVSLAKYIPKSEITAIDISSSALKIAKKNSVINEVQNQITFINSDLFANLTNQKFDIIVSNPPYIKKDMIETLNKEVKKEPIIALDGGDDGLDFYRKIIKDAYSYLKYGGHLCLEIGFDQKLDVIKLLEDEEKFTNIYCKKDLCGLDRIIVAKLM